MDYIAMEYVAGGTLADVLQTGPLPPDRACRSRRRLPTRSRRPTTRASCTAT